MKRVAEVLASRDVAWVNATDTVRQAVRRMCEMKTGAVLVYSGEGVVGVFTERDVLHRVVDPGKSPDEVPVKDVMSTKLIHVHMDDDLQMAKALMVMSRVRHLLVEGENRELVGVLSMRDLAEMESDEAAEIVHELNERYYEEAYKAKWWLSSNRLMVTPPQVPKDHK